MVCLSLKVKNNSETIVACLESVKKYLSFYVIQDLGSSDGTLDLIRNYLSEIPGRIVLEDPLPTARMSPSKFILLMEPETRLVGNLWKYEESDLTLLKSSASLEIRSYIFKKNIEDYEKHPGEISAYAFIEENEEKRRNRLLVSGKAKDVFFLGNHEGALKLLEREEKDWFNLYYSAICHFRMGNIEKGQYLALLAYENDPQRAEPLLLVAQNLRERGNNALAFYFARMGLKIPIPRDRLLIERSAYDLGLHYEIAITAFYVGEFDMGLKSCEAITLYSPPNHLTHSTQINTKFYITYVEPKSIQKYNSQQKYFNTCNPSLLWTDKGLLVNVRHVSYRQEGGIYYQLNPESSGKPYQSLNYIYREGSVEKLEAEDVSKCYLRSAQAEGLEDIRIFSYRNSLWFTATCLQMDGTPKMVLGNRKQVIPLIWNSKYCEKNWLPFEHGDKLLLIYGYDPFLILEVDPQTGICRIRKSSTKCFNSFRGGTSPRRWRSGYLFAVHEVINLFYFNRLIYMSLELEILEISKPFKVSRIGIEYLSGLEINSDTLYLGWGENDEQAYVGTLDLTVLLVVGIKG